MTPLDTSCARAAQRQGLAARLKSCRRAGVLPAAGWGHAVRLLEEITSFARGPPRWPFARLESVRSSRPSDLLDDAGWRPASELDPRASGSRVKDGHPVKGFCGNV